MNERGQQGLWDGVDRLIDRSTDLEALRAHGLHLLAARRWRNLGRSVPPELLYHEQMAAIATLAVPPLLQEIHQILDAPIVLLKGPEIAQRYLDPALRPFVDLDLLVSDADLAQQRLLAAGFSPVREAGKDLGSHHRPPIKARGWPLHVEIHDTPGWLPWMTPPSSAALIDSAVPSALELDGVLTLPDQTHALLIAAHSWRHVPLRRALDLVDVAAMSRDTDSEALEHLARQWGLARLWATTQGAVDALLVDPSHRSWSLTLWARHLAAVRELTDGQAIVLRGLGALWAPSPTKVIESALTEVRASLNPTPGESLTAAVRRVGRSAGRAVIEWSPFREQR